MTAERDFYEKLLEGISDGVYFMDRDRIIRYWNHGAERITGFKRDEVIGRACRDNVLMHVDDMGTRLCMTELCPAFATVMDGREREVEVHLHHKLGHRVPVLARISPIRDASGAITGAVEVFSENLRMHELIYRLRELEKLALIDPLTRIGNRRYGKIHVENGLSNLNRYGLPFGILFIDIDHFKKVNDTYGHETGDRVLQLLANTLLHNLRSSDAASRWGGEEFLTVVSHVEPREIGIIGRKMLSLIRSSLLDTPNGPLGVTASIGAVAARNGDSLESLVARADGLMYESKRKGRNRVTAED